MYNKFQAQQLLIQYITSTRCKSQLFLGWSVPLLIPGGCVNGRSLGLVCSGINQIRNGSGMLVLMFFSPLILNVCCCFVCVCVCVCVCCVFYFFNILFRSPVLVALRGLSFITGRIVSHEHFSVVK